MSAAVTAMVWDWIGSTEMPAEHKIVLLALAECTGPYAPVAVSPASGIACITGLPIAQVREVVADLLRQGNTISGVENSMWAEVFDDVPDRDIVVLFDPLPGEGA